MILSCTKNELISAIQFVSKAIASKPQTPILSGIYLKAENGELELHATNHELGMVCRIPADIEAPGQIVISGRYFQEVIRRLSGDNVTLSYEKNENIVHIQSARANFTLRSMPASEFPIVKQLEGNATFTLKDNTLRTLIKKTVYACATADDRPVFMGCHLNVDDNRVTMAATNSHRLAVQSEVLDESLGKIKAVIPSKVLQDLIHNMTSEVPTDVTISCSFNQISFAFENMYVTSRLIEGAFPDYTRAIPNDFAILVNVDTAELTSAVDRVALISRAGEYNNIKLEFGNGHIRLSSESQDVGRAEEQVEAEIEGPSLAISFNAQYIIDVLKNVDSKICQIRLNQTLSPALIRGKEEENFTYVVTPVRSKN